MLAKKGLTNPDKRPIAGLQTTSGDSIDTMAWHLVVLGVACLAGWTLKEILKAISYILHLSAVPTVYGCWFNHAVITTAV